MREPEADHLGLIYIAKAGYESRAARDLCVRRAPRAALGPWISSRPTPSEETRIRQIDAWPEALRDYTPPR